MKLDIYVLNCYKIIRFMTTGGPERPALYFPELEKRVTLKDPRGILALAKGLSNRHSQLTEADFVATIHPSAGNLDHIHRIRAEIEQGEAQLLASIASLWQEVDGIISQVPMPDDKGASESEPRMRQTEIPPEPLDERIFGGGPTASITETRSPYSDVVVVTYEHIRPPLPGAVPKTTELNFTTTEANRAALQSFALHESTDLSVLGNRIREVNVKFHPNGRFNVEWSESTSGGFAFQLPATVPA